MVKKTNKSPFWCSGRAPSFRSCSVRGSAPGPWGWGPHRLPRPHRPDVSSGEVGGDGASSCPGDPRFVSGRRRCPGFRRASGDSVRFEASGKLGEARGGPGPSPQPQGARFPMRKRIRNPWAEWRERKSWRREKAASLFLLRGIRRNVALKMKMPPEGGPRAGCALGSQGLLGGVSVSPAGREWRRGRAAMWIGESGGRGKGRGSQDPAAWGRRGQSHPRQGARRGSYLNPGEPVNHRGAGREGKESSECSAEKEPPRISPSRPVLPRLAGFPSEIPLFSTSASQHCGGRLGSEMVAQDGRSEWKQRWGCEAQELAGTGWGASKEHSRPEGERGPGGVMGAELNHQARQVHKQNITPAPPTCKMRQGCHCGLGTLYLHLSPNY